MDELTDHLLHSITGRAWEGIGTHPHHGINLPLSALHSKHSCGIGEFFDLIPIIDWCHQLKIDFIQLLPLNNSEGDPSPYNAVSSCALNIAYLSLHALPYLEKHKHLKAKLKDLTELNKTNKIAYTEVFTYKMSWLHAYFDEVGQKIVKSKELKKYISENPWVEYYALFRTLTDRLGGSPSTSWPPEVRSPSTKEFHELLKRYASDVSFFIVLQYLCYTQLKKVKEYANQKGVLLMGDLPILVSPESVDVWQHPDFFNTHLQAGAPPDFYNKEGQNWGFPIYQWDALRKKHFSWWKQRLTYAENFFNLFRLDHVLGFFRIWAIPPGRPSKEGSYVPPDEKEWEPQGRELLTMIASSTTMLPIAEDLGVVPKMVRPCIKEMGICGTKVMRWERVWEEDGRFLPIQYYPPISITCVSTHDSETLSLWWKNFSEEAKALADYKHWTYAPSLTDAQREEILWDSHHTSSLFHVNLLQEYFAFYPELSWPKPEDERINVPGQILPTNWTYRFRPSVEEITSHKELFAKIERIIFSPTPPALNLS
ncbi:MAG: 4-alpha-glucanotransferase [Verrucomicrobia bacterium]|nr:4-alpha-glucanotransferase [Verrucomicrobiota bacterium]